MRYPNFISFEACQFQIPVQEIQVSFVVAENHLSPATGTGRYVYVLQFFERLAIGGVLDNLLVKEIDLFPLQERHFLGVPVFPLIIAQENEPRMRRRRRDRHAP